VIDELRRLVRNGQPRIGSTLSAMAVRAFGSMRRPIARLARWH
jgi:hypothetical protein